MPEKRPYTLDLTDFYTWREWVARTERHMREAGIDPETVRLRSVTYEPEADGALRDTYVMFIDPETDDVIAAKEQRTSEIVTVTQD